MLQSLLEILLSLLAVFGLFSLGWMLFGRLLAPGDFCGPAYAVVPARGDGASLEQTVRGLLWLRAGVYQRYTVIIADAGLSERGRAVAAALAGREPRVVVCPMAALSEYLMCE